MATNSIKYIIKTLSSSYPKEITQVCSNMSWILGDNDGMLNASTAKSVLQGLNILPGGILVMQDTSSISGGDNTGGGGMVMSIQDTMDGNMDMGDGMDMGSTDDSYTPPIFSSHLPLDSVVPYVSEHAYSMFQSIKQLDSTFVLPSTLQYSITSPLILNSLNLTLKYAGMCHALFLEGYALYHGLLWGNMQVGLSTLTKSDITRIDANIRWLTSELEQMNKPQYDMISILRDFQRTILYVRGLDYLYTTTYSNQLDSYNNAIGGVYDNVQ